MISKSMVSKRSKPQTLVDSGVKKAHIPRTFLKLACVCVCVCRVRAFKSFLEWFCRAQYTVVMNCGCLAVCWDSSSSSHSVRLCTCWVTAPLSPCPSALNFSESGFVRQYLRHNNVPSRTTHLFGHSPRPVLFFILGSR